MSKRKNRKNSAPNLPQETLDRARREAGLEPMAQSAADEIAAAEAERDAEPVAVAPPRPRRTETDSPRPAPRRSDQLPAAQQSRRRRKEVAYEEMTQEEVIYLLEHPTKQVDEEELRQQYSYVLADLRNMGLLAAALFVAFFVVAGVVVVG